MKLSIKSDNHKLQNSIGIEESSMKMRVLIQLLTRVIISCDYHEFLLYPGENRY